MAIINIPVLYLIIINLTGFAMMGIDKRRAVRHRWRVRESTLFAIAIIGGSVGSMLAMRLFHHKTKHWYFVYGLPFILLLQIVFAVLLLQFAIK